ncbi:amino acid adenylation domain-containing protein [Luteococcus japonicus]|uniref:Malonyl CoA-acyl carrier protein transacylase n=1 Tax=Luteococcus japonicus LSP_Lj1 TaxID=1255658 RepID=A0A1R4KG85_9ACTN|nr:non-ribosomal peptide synthetase [Luteococcus japonicus]SJN43245.1 Malonyl CoA-acyl carrier protein transacylase [Luteococcus japonicus LSP_Lj1]
MSTATTSLPLSPAQHGLWLAQQNLADPTAFACQETIRLTGPLDPLRWQQAVDQALHETTVTRAAVREDPEPHLVLLDRCPVTAQVEDLRTMPDPEAALAQRLTEWQHTPLDPTRGLVGQVTLFRVGEQSCAWCWRIHHLALDGYGFALLARRVAEIHAAGPGAVRPGSTPLDLPAIRSLAEHPLPPLPDDSELASREAVDLGTTEPEPGRAGPGTTQEVSWECDRRVTPQEAFAALARAVHRATGAQSCSIGMFSAARTTREALQTVTNLQDVVPVLVEVDAWTSAAQLIGRVEQAMQQALRSAGARQERRARALGGRPLADVWLNIVPFHQQLRLGETVGEATPEWEGPVAGLTVTLQPGRDASRITVEAPAHDPREVVEGFAALLRESLQDPDTLLAEPTKGLRPAMTDAEVDRWLSCSPSARIVGPDAALDPTELAARVARLAGALHQAGAGPRQPFVIALPRVTDAVLAQVAALRIGAPFVTADPSLGSHHVAEVMQRSRATILLHHPETIPLPVSAVTGLDPRTLPDPLPRASTPTPTGKDPAYVMWTSGSTGRPKGVVVTRANLAAFVRRHAQCLHPALTDGEDAGGLENVRVSHNHPFTFDSALSPLAALLRGAEVHLAPEQTAADPQALATFCMERELDMLDVSPAVLAAMVEGTDGDDSLLEDPRGPKLVVVGGDACPTALWQRLANSPVRAWNAYGPTEATVDATGTWIEEGPVHLGTALPGVEARVLDATLTPCPPGVAGEFYLGGDGITEGYLDDPAQTATRFMPDPWGPPGSRMYRTGDRVRRMPEGLVFLGRTDAQLSIRGRRVEAAEIEGALDALPGVARSAVRLAPGPQGPVVVGAVVPDHDATPDWPARVLDQARHRLPAALQPAALVAVDALPLTSRGKLDRDRLPVPDLTAGVVADPSTPGNALEEYLAERACEVLGLERVGVRTDLRGLGLHSLASARLAALLRQDLGVGLRLADLAAHPTITALADELVVRGVDPTALSAPATQTEAVATPAAGPADPRPATPAQARLVYLQESGQADPATYVVPVEITLIGSLDAEVLRLALLDVVAAHPALHSRLVRQQETLVSIPCSADEVSALVEVVQLHDADEQQWLAQARRGFDLARQLPVRLVLDSNPEGHRILLCLHHVAADGASVPVLLEDLATALHARTTTGLAPQLRRDRPAAPGGEPTDEDERRADLSAWREALTGAPATTRLPLDRPRKAPRNNAGSQVTSTLDADTTAALRRVATQSTGTLFTVLHAALAGLLTRWGAGDDVVLGAVLSTRGPQDPPVGFAVDTVPLRSDLSGRPTFLDLCRRVASHDTEAFSRALGSGLGLDDIVREVNPVRDPRHHPLFQTVLVVQEPERLPDLRGLGLGIAVRTLPTATAKFDLTLEVTPTGVDGDELSLRWEYATDILDRESVARLDVSFHHLVQGWLADPSASLWARPAVPEREIVAPASAPAPTSTPLWDDGVESLADAWRAAVSRHHDRIAVTEGTHQVSHGELHQRALALAAALQRAGVRPRDRVALAVGRGTNQVVAVLGTVLAGASYVPLDPAYPLERLQLVLDDSTPTVLVVDTRQDGLGEVRRAAERLGLPEVDLAAAPVDATADPVRVSGGDIAYVLYTSGSTGHPKGVCVTHHDVLRLLDTTRDLVPCGPQDVWTLFHSYAFDFSVWEMYGALLLGGRLVVVPHETTRDPAAFARLVDREGVTVLNQTPSAFHHVIAETTRAGAELELASLRTVVLGGEALDPHSLQAWWQHFGERVQIVNMYGITETTVHVTHRVVTPADRDGSPVGVALPDLSVRLLDEGLHRVPPGAVGEIHVAGEGLSEGYLGRPDLTATRFVPDPWGPPGSRMYRSGDLAVVDAEGRLDFCGRSDAQVQLRGFRVELGEVEAALAAADEVTTAHAVVLEPGTDRAALVGYVTGPDPADADPVQILAAVRAQVPPQSVPSAVVVLDRFPLTVNGKLDVAALPRPELSRRRDDRHPSPGAEQLVAEAFCEVLALDEVGATESFFEIGGHSLTAVRVLRRLEEHTGTRIPISTFFAHPSVESLATQLEAGPADTASHTVDLASLLVLRPAPAGEEPGIFCLHPAGGLAWCYSGLAAHLPPSVALWGLQARGLSGGRPPSSLGEMAQDYLKQILEVQPHGPYRLLGWSLGGMVAHEVAVRLEERGERVDLLALLDAYPSEGLSSGEEREAADAFSALLAMAGIDDRELSGRLGRPLVLADCVTALRESQGPMANLDEAAIESLRTTYAATAAILTTHHHRHFDGPVRFYRAARGGMTEDDHSPAQWQEFAREVHVVDVDANHRQMTRPGPLSVVGRDLATLLGHGS